ncbi:hypothetical protein [Psychrobacter maritimus]|uniref:hypothetical protein n=1 Tax=Psychrobacter maritimus TaxID=256325 RepID=UPI0039B0AAC4
MIEKIKRFTYLFFAKSWFAKLLRNPVLTLVLPALISFYYLALDVWGDDWSWIANYRQLHEYIFGLLFITTMFVVAFKALYEIFSRNIDRKKEEALKNLIKIFNNLVASKKRRFYEEAAGILPNADCFKKITKPDEQLKSIFDATIEAVATIFDVNRLNLTITIIEGDEHGKWWYALRSNNQTRLTPAKKLMENNSTARYCLDNGQSLFIADMRKGIKNEVFFSSDRSRSQKDYGSIFCKPVVVKVGNREFKYVFTICLYGELICAPHSEEETRVCEEFFVEISDRVELELHLKSIKKFRYS